MRLGIIGSSGGSALKAAAEIYSQHFPLELIVLTDRPCGLGVWAAESGHFSKRSEYVSPEVFSAWANEEFESHGCSDVLLFYTRIVAAPLIHSRKVWNIHPALLPSFRGLHGVADARKCGVTLFGATLHHVDATLDTGPIDTQVCSPMPVIDRDSRSDRLSYIHKVWLTLVFFETLAGRRKADPFFYSWEKGAMIASAGVGAESIEIEFIKWLENTEK